MFVGKSIISLDLKKTKKGKDLHLGDEFHR
jgi:hypothetical protein